MRILSVVLVLIGCVLLFLGVSMRAKQHVFTRLETEVREGNRGTAIAVGAGTGAVVGGTAAATIGGVGIAACGTGVGIPAGVVCLLAAGVCAVVGGAAGAAFGTSDETITTPVTEMVNAYSPIEYWTVLIIGALMVCIGLYLLLWTKRPIR